MDFLALPRRDLQALCKRNGVRANMTNAAMADALCALPKVDGIEEYVKLPVPVPKPPVQAVVEEKNVGKQGNPLPRGRRAVAKSSEPVEPEEDNEEEKRNAKRQSSNEDAPALGVGRRGASRRTRPVPVVPQSAAVAEEEGQGEEDLKREAKRDDAPAPVVGRRGASRRAWPSPAMAAQEAESEVPGAEDEQREEVEDHKWEATMDDVPALGVGRRGANRRARVAPSVAALGGKVVAEEEQRAPIPCGRRSKAKGTSAEPIRLNDSDDEEKEQEDAQILDMGQGGRAGRRSEAAPAVAAPEAKAEEEQRAPVPRGRRVKANSVELIRMDDSKEHTKPEEERGDVPAIAVGRHGPRGRAPAAPSEAPATMRSAAASKADAGDVAVEAAPIRATRQRKPTMKAAAAAAAAEEKAPRRATRRGEVISTVLQQEVHEEPHEAVGAPDMALEAVPIRAARQRKPTMKAAAAAAMVEEMAPPRARRGAVMRTVLQPEAQEEPQEAVGAPICYQQCDAQEELEETSNPQKEELNKVDAPKQDEDQDFIITEDEKLMEETPAEEPSVTDQECTDKSEMQEQLADDEKCHALAIHEESPILGLVSMVTEQASEDDKEAVDKPVSHLRCDALEELAETSSPQKEELNEVDAPKQDKDQDVVISEDEMLMEGTPAEESSVTDDAQDEPEEAVGAPVCYQQCEDQDLVIIEDEKLMEETLAEEPSVTDKECTDKSEIQEQEQLVDDEKYHAPLAIHEESPILGLVSMVTEQASEDDKEAVDASVSHLRCDPLEKLAEASDPQKEELNEVDAPKQDEDQDVVVSEDEMLMEETPAEESSMTDDAQDEPEEAVGALVSYQRCDDLEELAEVSDPQKEELNEVNTPKHDEDQDLVIIEDEKLMEEIPAEEASVTDQECMDKTKIQEQLVDDEKCDAPLSNNEDPPILGLVSAVTEQASEGNEEAVDAPVSHQRCDAMEEMADASDPQKEELNEVDAPRQDEDQDVIICEDDKLMEETIIEEPSVIHQEWMDNSKIQEQQVDDETCHALLPTHKESPILGLVSTVTEQASQADVGASFQDDGVSCSSLLDKGTYDAAEEMELVVKTLQAPLTGNESDASDANHESEMGNFNEVLTFRDEITEVDTQEVSNEAGFLDCSSNISQVAEEINKKVNTVGVVTNEEVNTEDGLGSQEGGDVLVDKVLHDWVDNTILLDCSSDISWVELEKAGNITSEMPENQAALDEDGGEQMEVITTDKVLDLTGSNVENVEEKNSAEPMAVIEEKGVKVASECEDLNKLSLRQLKGKLKETLNAKKNKEAKKRVALARVDENVCRSHAKRQHQGLNLQQH